MHEVSKKQTASIGGDFCVWGWNGKIFQYKIGMIRLKLLNSCFFPLWKNFDRNRSQQQLASTNYHHNQIIVENFTEISLQSEFSLQRSSQLNEFSLMREDMFNHNSSPDSFHDPTMLAVQSGLRPGVEFTSKCGDGYQEDSFHRLEGSLHWRGTHRDLCILWFRCYLIPWRYQLGEEKFPKTMQRPQI